MAETLLSFGVQKVWDLLVRESDRLKEVDEQLSELKSNLKLLRSFLKDADAKKHESETVRNFVEEINEIVFDTEDIIETFLLKEELRNQSGIRNTVRRLSCIIGDRRKIASDIRSMSKRISKVICDMERFGVQPMIVNGGEYSRPLQERQMEMRKTFPSNNENDLVGVEENVKKLVGYLVEEDSSQVVSIIGMGGIGKTTLARQVFNHEMVKNHFDGVAWVCISQHFSRKLVWQTIFQKLSSKQNEHRESKSSQKLSSEMSEDEVQEKLFQLLETSNSLIVLDDMWKKEDWDKIKLVLPSKKGWKVLLTSRNENVALYADPTCVTVKPECLTTDESWTLFRWIAFPKIERTKFEVGVEMEEMGKKMIKHCGGLPLAVKVLGGLLATQSLSNWKRISKNIKSHIVGGTSFNDSDMSSVYHILYLSIEELPIYLKQCFLYLAHFPEDHPIRVWDLSYYWAAEGIPRPRYYDGVTIEEVGNGYIEELVKRNMVISKIDVTTSRFEICHLHDMMREVCLLQAGKENFVHIVDTANSQSPCISRRIVVNQLNETYHPVGEMIYPKLRSLLFTWNQVYGQYAKSGLWFTRLQLMRVLDLSRVDFGEKLPSSIGKLIHLRYLSLYDANLTHLPLSMRNLKQLLYLNLTTRDGSLTYIPNFLKEMRELAYLSLPRRMHDKTKLEMGNLVNMEMLGNFSTKHSNVDLRRMTKLRILDIYIRGKGCTTATLFSSLSDLPHLEDLSINDEEFFYAPKNDKEGFVLDWVHLKKLTLGIYMPKLPDEQQLPSHLTFITLFKSGLEEDPMPILEKLLELKEVRLHYQPFSGKRMVCSGSGFPQLHLLELYGLEEWEEWIVEEGSMPLLHSLDIQKCPKLKDLHMRFSFPKLQKLFISGLEEFEEWIVEEGSMPLLHTLTIRNCPKLKELPDGLRFIYSLKRLSMPKRWQERLSEGGEDYYKIQHIPSIEFDKE